MGEIHDTNNICVIYDTDEKYTEKLMNAIEGIKGKSIKIIAFTETELIEEYIKSNHINILIISEIDCSNTIKEQLDNVDEVILLSEEYLPKNYCDTFDGLSGGYTIIYKYQSSEKIIKQVMSVFQKKHITRSIKTSIVGIYSPINCAYKTSLSLALSNVYAEKYSTLYINLEEFSGLEEIMPDKNNWNLSDFMYCYECSKEQLLDKLDSQTGNLSNNEKIRYIAPVKCSTDISYITVGKLADMIMFIAGQRIFDIIVLDISNMVFEQWKLMDICNKVYMPIKDDYISRKKLNSFETYLLSSDEEMVCDNIEKIQVPYDEQSQLEAECINKISESCIGRFARKLAYG